jgi:hypothetical protein
MCHLTNRQIAGCHNEVIDYIQGTQGRLTIGKGAAPFIEGEKRWRWRGEEKNMYDLEHQALFNAIRKGEVINDGDRMMSSHAHRHHGPRSRLHRPEDCLEG